MKPYLFLFIPLIFFSCEHDENFTADQLLQKMEAITESIDDLVSTSCANVDQCKAAAIGAKACGGPTHYIIYSFGTDEAELNILISQYTEANKRYNELSEAFSDCSIVLQRWNVFRGTARRLWSS